MKPATSLYLDILRFGAALVVFFSHYSSGRLSGGLFWQIQDYGHIAVIAFFVLSGLVIAYAADTKEKTLHTYCVNRLSRLYSVVVPAIVLTIMADAIGTRAAPELYTASWGYSDSEPLVRIALALSFTSEIWFAHYEVFSMGTFWSLPYEVWYYILFGSIFFLPGRWRWCGAVLAMAIAGPKILFLLPIWLIGVATYCGIRSLQLRGVFGWGILLGSAVIFALGQYFGLGQHSLNLVKGWVSPDILKLYCQMSWSPYDYLVGVLVAANILGFHAVGDSVIGLLQPLKPAIRWLAGLTFSLYLFHLPLLQVYRAISPWSGGDWRNRIFLVVVTLSSIAVLSSVTERRRGGLRDWLGRTIPDGGRWPIMGFRGNSLRVAP
jgi:peptidoglycan/LPS O-acetylase OafA/YrhL